VCRHSGGALISIKKTKGINMKDKIITRALQHYKDVCSENENQIEIPEWGEPGKPLIICWTPLTMTQIAILQKKSSDDYDRLVRLIVMKAETPDGEKIFDDPVHDKIKLMKGASSEVLGRISKAMSAGVGDVEEEDSEGE